MTITIYGASDDLIEIEGDIRAEFPAHYDAENLIALSNGCIFRIAYTGVWRITPVVLAAGAQWDKVEAVSEDHDNYSDRLTVTSDVSWVAHSIGYAS